MPDEDVWSTLLDVAEVAEKVVTYGIGPIRLVGKALDPTPKFLAGRDKIMDEWWVEVLNAQNAHARRLTALERAKVLERFDDDEAIGILAVYVQETYQEPLRERRRMLLHAAAGLANLSLGVAELARVQRVLRELEPDDLIVLYGLWLTTGRAANAPATANSLAIFRLEQWHASGAESLETAGCVRVEAKGGGFGTGTHEELSITRTGRLVLRALRSYLAARKPDLSSVPGHEVAAEFRSEEDARSLIASVPGLYAALLAHRGIGFGPIQYTSITPARGLPATGKTRLILDMPTPTAEALRQATTREVAEHGTPVVGIFVDVVSPTADPEWVSIQIAGPHDVLRWLAYDLDAYWA